MISLLYMRGRKLVALFIGRAATRCTSFNCTVVGVRVAWRAGIQYTMSFHWSEGTGSFGCTKILGRVW